MLKKLVLFPVIVLAVLYGGAEFAAASYAEKAIARSAEEHAPLAQDVEARVSKPLLLSLIRSSSITRLEISTSHISVGPIIADRATAVLYGIRLDLGASIQQRQPVVESIQRMDMTVEISAESASAVLPDGFRFEFQSGGTVILEGPGASVGGTLTFTAPATVRFEPSEGVLPPGVSAQWTFEEIPFVTCLESLAIEQGIARLTCSRDNPPAQFPPAE